MATNVTSLLRKGSSSASGWVQMCSSVLTTLVIGTLQRPSSLLATNPPVCTPALPHPHCSSVLMPARAGRNQSSTERFRFNLKRNPSCSPAARRKQA